MAMNLEAWDAESLLLVHEALVEAGSRRYETAQLVRGEIFRRLSGGRALCVGCGSGAADGFGGVFHGEDCSRLSAGNPQAEKVRATEIIRALVYAGDGCRGHRDCAHSMQPWQDARSYLADMDGEPLQEPERSDGRILCVSGPQCEGAVVLVPYCEAHDPRSGEQRETRIQGENGARMGTQWEDGCPCGAEGSHPLTMRCGPPRTQAQRSVGRIEAETHTDAQAVIDHGIGWVEAK